MDVQMAEQIEELLPAPEIEDPHLSDDEEEYWKSFDDVSIPQHDGQFLPAGCPETRMHRNAYQVLEEFRQVAGIDPEVKYSSPIARQHMQAGLSCAANGMQPRFYQIDCAEAFLLGINTGLICPTGSGKTEAFILPLFADPQRKSKIIIISPLNALQDDHVSNFKCIYSINLPVVVQAKRFQRYGISAAAVNGETYSKSLHEVSILFES